MSFWLDGRVTAVVGTHTHVQTADEKILPNSTAYITDVGICGPSDSVIGCDVDLAIRRQITQIPFKPTPAMTAVEIDGVIIDSDINTGKAVSITRFRDIKKKKKKRSVLSYCYRKEIIPFQKTEQYLL